MAQTMCFGCPDVTCRAEARVVPFIANGIGIFFWVGDLTSRISATLSSEVSKRISLETEYCFKLRFYRVLSLQVQER